MAFDILWMNVAAVFALANVAMVLVLLSVYLQSWMKTRTGFAMGLVLFAVFFLIQNAVIVIFWYVLYSLVPAAQGIVVAAAPYLVLINLAETIALGNLVRITLK
jgi:hypothetical protein